MSFTAGNILSIPNESSATLNCKAIYGTITENNFSRLSQFTIQANQLANKGAGGDPFTTADGLDQWLSTKNAWRVKTLANTTPGADSFIVQSHFLGQGYYYLMSRLWTGVSLWNTSSIVGEKVFQIRAHRNQGHDCRIYFTTYTAAEGLPTTTMEEVYTDGQTFLVGWNWYDLNVPMTMKNRLLVASAPEDLTFRGVGIYWSIQEYGGTSNPDNFETRHYTEPE